MADPKETPCSGNEPTNRENQHKECNARSDVCECAYVCAYVCVRVWVRASICVVYRTVA